MTHQHQLLFLAPSLPTSALCCFAALVSRRARNPMPVTGMELASFDADSLIEELPPAVVHIYQPQSSLQPDSSRQNRKIGRGNSDELAEKSPRSHAWRRDAKDELRRTNTLGRWDPSATAPCDHQHPHRQQRRLRRPLSLQLWDDMPSLPALLEAILLKRRAAPEAHLAVATVASTLRDDRKTLRRQQRLVVAEYSEDELGDVASHSVEGNSGTDCRPGNADKALHNNPIIVVTDCDGQRILFTDSVTDGTLVSTQAEDGPANVMNDLSKSLGEADTIADIHVRNSILQSVIDVAVVSPGEDLIDGGGKVDLNFDIDELLLRFDVPIGESTTRDAAAVAALEASEAELARAEPLATAAPRDTQQPHRLSDTGSELANTEFRFLRAPPPIPVKAVLPETAMIAPPLPTVGTLKPSQQQPRDKRSEFRKRLHRWRQSYAMDGKALSTLADWGDDQPAVLVSARPPSSPARPVPPSPVLPPASVQFRAVIFHPASLAVSAARLVDHFSNEGHPAKSWTQLHSDGSAERRTSRRGRLVARLFSGSFSSRSLSLHQSEALKSALLRCANDDILPVLLLPPRLIRTPQVGKAEANKFQRQMRSAIVELQPVRLTAGLLVVFTDSGYPDDAACWASAAREASPAFLTVTAPEETFSVTDSCHGILTAARHCATMAALQRLL